MKILVVDDELISRLALIDAIRQLGSHQIIEAESAEAAWPLMADAAIPPSLVCCDVRMHGQTGVELLQKVRAHPVLQDLPFVLITMASDVETVRTAIQEGVSGYIVKPFTQKDAEERLLKALSLSRSRCIEAANTTCERLQLSVERYRVYLENLQRQLVALLIQEPSETRLQWVERQRCHMGMLRDGLELLGFWRAAELFDRLSQGVGESVDVIEALDELQQQIREQLAELD